jgi:hypothetical protein
MTSTTLTRGQAIRRRQIVYRLLDRLDLLTTVKAASWLRFFRLVVWVLAGGAYASGWRFDVLLALIIAVVIEIAAFRVALIEVLKTYD